LSFDGGCLKGVCVVEGIGVVGCCCVFSCMCLVCLCFLPLYCGEVLALRACSEPLAVYGAAVLADPLVEGLGVLGFIVPFLGLLLLSEGSLDVGLVEAGFS